jgi:anti-anti-sigma factor
MRQPRFVTHPLGASVSILAVEGEHDVATRQDLRVALESMFADGRSVILDLSRATFIDSTILGLLFYTRRRPKRRMGERFVVVAPPGGAAARLFILTGASTVFSTFPSCSEAVAWYAEHPAREGASRNLHAPQSTTSSS